MLTVLDLAQEDIQFNQRASTRSEKKGPCPGCGGKDRFSVRWNNKSWRFMCRGCWDAQEILTAEIAKTIGKPKKAGLKRGWGDEIDYLRHYRKMSYQHARNMIGSPDDGELHMSKQIIRPPSWQETIARCVKEYEDQLWYSEDATALDYVKARGLREPIIKQVHLGYSVRDNIPRLIIPSYNNGSYVAVYRRDLRLNIDHSERWRDVRGSSKDELYLADSLRMRRPTILVESPICALTIAQECIDMVNAVATGGVDAARSPLSLAQLALMPIVFVAFDADSAGDENSLWWLKRLPNAKRLRPYLKDVNDMWVAGWDIRAWIAQSLQRYPVTTKVSDTEVIPSDYKEILENPEYYCIQCLEENIDNIVIAVAEWRGSWYCANHLPDTAKWELAGFDVMKNGTWCLPGNR